MTLKRIIIENYRYFNNEEEDVVIFGIYGKPHDWNADMDFIFAFKLVKDLEKQERFSIKLSLDEYYSHFSPDYITNEIKKIGNAMCLVHIDKIDFKYVICEVAGIDVKKNWTVRIPAELFMKGLQWYVKNKMPFELTDDEIKAYGFHHTGWAGDSVDV